MKENIIDRLRHLARKLIRELGVLKLNMSKNRAPQHWHTLIEISNEPNITISKLGNLLLLSSSSISRIVKALMKEGLVASEDGLDKREKYLQIISQWLIWSFLFVNLIEGSDKAAKCCKR
jgi:DNA-binding MarR family transcriptional regulator